MNIKEKITSSWESYQLSIIECFSGLTFDVTQDHILKGERDSYRLTPVQLSIKSGFANKYGFEVVFCDLDYTPYCGLLRVRFPVTDGETLPLMHSRSVEVVLTDGLEQWIRAWKKMELVEPITIRFQEASDKEWIFRLEAAIVTD